MLKGPEVRGCKPVLVTFSYFKDREEVFQKSKLLQSNCQILVTEDMSKKTREARYELQKHLVKLARSRPSKKAQIRYDKLYVDGMVFIYSEEEQRVVPYDGGRSSRMSSLSRAPSLDRSLAMSTPDLTRSSSYFRSPSPSFSSNHDLPSSTESKVTELETVIQQQKATISQQKNDIAEHKRIIKKLERAVQHLYKEDYNLEDIDD